MGEVGSMKFAYADPPYLGSAMTKFVNLATGGSPVFGE